MKAKWADSPKVVTIPKDKPLASKWADDSLPLPPPSKSEAGPKVVVVDKTKPLVSKWADASDPEPTPDTKPKNHKEARRKDKKESRTPEKERRRSDAHEPRAPLSQAGRDFGARIGAPPKAGAHKETRAPPPRDRDSRRPTTKHKDLKEDRHSREDKHPREERHPREDRHRKEEKHQEEKHAREHDGLHKDNKPMSQAGKEFAARLGVKEDTLASKLSKATIQDSKYQTPRQRREELQRKAKEEEQRKKEQERAAHEEKLKEEVREMFAKMENKSISWADIDDDF